MWRLAATVLLTWLLGGCGDESKQPPYLMGQKQANPYAAQVKERSEKIEAARIEAQTQKEIALVNKERDIKIQELKSDTEVTTAGINKEVAIEEVKTRQIAIEKESEHSNYVLILTVIALVLLFMFLFHYTGKNRKERLKKHEDDLMFKLRSQEQEVKMKMAEKMLDSLASGKLSEAQETRLLETLEHTTTRLIGQKK